MTERPLAVGLAVVIGVSIIGFMRGTAPSDYDLATPLTVWAPPEDEGIPVTPTYAQERGKGASGGEVASECADCHEERVVRVSSGHRTEHPVDVIVDGRAATAVANAGGRLGTDERGNLTVVCRSCHRPHNAAQEAELVAPADDGTLCLYCHSAESPASSRHPVSGSIAGALVSAVRALGGTPGSALGCGSCHTPHDARSGSLLRTAGSGSEACDDCHSEKARALGSHGHGGQTCTDCHGMHRSPARIGRGPEAAEPSDQPCLDCHAVSDATKRIDPSRGHPIGAAMTEAMANRGHAGTVGCTDCHTPHSQVEKVLAKGSVLETCADCHPDKRSVEGTRHDGAVVAAGGRSETCLTCHSVHGEGDLPVPPATANPASAVCLSCHDGRTKAKEIEKWTHPTGLLLTAGGLPARYTGTVPFFGPDGRRTSKRETGEIACQTCHDPHRWKHDAESHPGDVEGSEQDSFLRDPAQVIAFCTVCHDNDGRPRFRFFHREMFRKDESR